MLTKYIKKHSPKSSGTSVLYIRSMVPEVQSAHYSCQILLEFHFSRRIFEKYGNMKYFENPCSRRRVFPCGWTDHPILILRPPFLFTSSSTTVWAPSNAQTFVVVSSLSSCTIPTMKTGDSYLCSIAHGVVPKKTGIISTTIETSSPVQRNENILLYEDSALLLKTLWSGFVG